MKPGRYGVWCEVWGGVTGDRAAWLKRDGGLMRYDTLEQAQIAADEMDAKRSGDLRHVMYRYTAKPLEQADD